MTDIFIKNDKGEFEKYGEEFTGFPANGIWFVEDGRRSCIYEMKDVSKFPSPQIASYMQYKLEFEEYLSNEWSKKPLSVRDVSALACEFFAIKSGALKVLDEVIEG